MPHIDIIRATTEDIVRVQTIGSQTFEETFSADNTAENMNAYLEEGFSIQRVTQELNHPNTEFYLAVLDQRVIGYLKLNLGNAQTEIKDQHALEIERIYVLKDFHGKGVGQCLYDKAMAVAKEKGVDYVWLGVWEKNTRAIRFYEKNGFVAFDTHIFRLGDDEQTDLMMKLPLNTPMQKIIHLP